MRALVIALRGEVNRDLKLEVGSRVLDSSERFEGGGNRACESRRNSLEEVGGEVRRERLPDIEVHHAGQANGLRWWSDC